MWSVLLGKGVTVVGVHPPVAFTNLRDKMLVRGRWMKPFVKLIMKTPVQAAQTTVFAAVDPSIVNGQMYRSVLLHLSQWVTLTFADCNRCQFADCFRSSVSLI